MRIRQNKGSLVFRPLKTGRPGLPGTSCDRPGRVGLPRKQPGARGRQRESNEFERRSLGGATGAAAGRSKHWNLGWRTGSEKEEQLTWPC